jgi:hypothetical protein
MIPVFERTKTVHALDRAATVIGTLICIALKFNVALGLKNLRGYDIPYTGLNKLIIRFRYFET